MRNEILDLLRSARRESAAPSSTRSARTSRSRCLRAFQDGAAVAPRVERNRAGARPHVRNSGVQLDEVSMADCATLVVLRHAQSERNRANRFTGWMDVPRVAARRRTGDSARRADRRAGSSVRSGCDVAAAPRQGIRSI